MRDFTAPEELGAALRAEFDHGFAAATSAPHGSLVELLAIRVAGRAYALRLSEVGLIAVDRRIACLPSPLPALGGLCTVRGLLMAVYDLGAILGHARTANPRWLMLASRSEPVALAFEAFEGQFRVEATQIAMPARPADPTQVSGRALVHPLMGIDGPARPIVDVAAVMAAIEEQVGRSLPQRSDER